MTAESVEVRCAAALDNAEFLSAVYTRHQFSKHMHDTHAFGVIYGGIGRVWCAGRIHLGTPGDVIAIAPGVVHTGAEGPRAENAPFRYRMIYPSHHIVARVTEQLELRHVPMPRGEPMLRDRAVAHRLHRLLDAVQKDAPALEIETHFFSFISRHRTRRSASVALADRAPRIVTRVREYLDANTHTNVRLADLVRITGVHPLYLCRIFKTHVGLAPHAYSIHARLARGKDLLREGHAVSDVAIATGFADQSHFGRHFVRATGVTPASYRRMISRSKERSSD